MKIFPRKRETKSMAQSVVEVVHFQLGDIIVTIKDYTTAPIRLHFWVWESERRCDDAVDVDDNNDYYYDGVGC